MSGIKFGTAELFKTRMQLQGAAYREAILGTSIGRGIQWEI
jgi:hypothetical protein